MSSGSDFVLRIRADVGPSTLAGTVGFSDTA
jgi:hypothetical protein